MTNSERFRKQYGNVASPDAIRRVWADITTHPRASTREIADRVGFCFSVVAASLNYLDGAGYITSHGSRAYTIVVPFVVIERKG